MPCAYLMKHRWIRPLPGAWAICMGIYRPMVAKIDLILTRRVLKILVVNLLLSAPGVCWYVRENLYILYLLTET